MLEAFEEFCKAHEKTIAFVEAFSTLAAVIVSLSFAYLAGRANRTRLKAWVDIKRIVHSTIPPETRLRYLTATITNTGIMPLRVPFGFFSLAATPTEKRIMDDQSSRCLRHGSVGFATKIFCRDS